MDFGLRFGKSNRPLLRFVQTEPILGVTEDIFFFTTNRQHARFSGRRIRSVWGRDTGRDADGDGGRLQE
jgi:hypothetical protein